MENSTEPTGEARCSVALDVFEGPLDLLLHLVRRHELEILDIPIAFVTEKYLEYLALMRAMDLEIAGDYLVMAATLAYLKSRELLPPDPDESDEALDDEDGEDPREALIQQLLEYQRFRTAAAELDGLPVSGRDVFGRGLDVELPPVDPGLAPVTLFKLAEAFHRVLERARIRKSHDVVLETVSVAQRMEQLSQILGGQEQLDFDRLFLDREWDSERELRTMLIVTLMSILELAKLGIIKIHQPEGSVSILLEQTVAADVARKMIEGYDEESSYGAASTDTDEDSEGERT
jgi:segregation and condensation protein A